MAVNAPDLAEPGTETAHPGMFGAVRDTVQRFMGDQMMDRAAALTYYTMMSLFPALFVIVALLGLLGSQALVQDAVTYAAEQGADPSVVDALEQSLSGAIERSGSGLGFAALIGVTLALYGASGAFGAAGRALNVVHRVEDDRGFVRQKLENLGWTLVVILLAIVALVSVFLGGTIAEDLFGRLGLGTLAADVWRFARWVAALSAALGIYAILYAFAPDIEPRRMRWLTPGALVGVVAWLVASAGFFFYVQNFGSYGATYGAFAAAVVLLLWLWLTNLCLLFGAELNAVLGARKGAGVSLDEQP